MSIPGPAGNLEASAADHPKGRAIAVLCHPHPLFGGTMDNKVVVTLARALQEQQVSTVRFNFRGVGSSAGTFDQGVGELADASAIAAWARRRWPDLPLMCAGFSFGANIALRIALAEEVIDLITVAPPVARFSMQTLAAPACPWLIVQGDEDDVVSAAEVIDWSETRSPKPQLVLMQGAGHFFHGNLTALKEIVSVHAREVLRE